MIQNVLTMQFGERSCETRAASKEAVLLLGARSCEKLQAQSRQRTCVFLNDANEMIVTPRDMQRIAKTFQKATPKQNCPSFRARRDTTTARELVANFGPRNEERTRESRATNTRNAMPAPTIANGLQR